ncbi:MAG TPA: PilZ domain-containing protein [Terriglobales bacterium]|nr:PilZ domain-containing protein [Terriglobales bacterium]
MDSPEATDKWPIPRKHQRFLIDLRLVVKAATTLHGRTKNISESGMAATLAGDISLGTIVELQFHLPQTPKPMIIHAEVRYNQGFQYGFKFINITAQQAETIGRVLRKFPIDSTFVKP